MDQPLGPHVSAPNLLDQSWFDAKINKISKTKSTKPMTTYHPDTCLGHRASAWDTDKALVPLSTSATPPRMPSIGPLGVIRGCSGEFKQLPWLSEEFLR